jgi:nucleoside 2-deoxyribosyltransferase
MKIYFTTNVVDIDNIRVNVDNIYQTVEKLGHTIDRFNYQKNPQAKFDTDDNNDEMIKAFDYISKAIKSSDFVIAELSSSSAAVGFEIAFALSEKKPVLVLYDETKQKSLATPFRGNKSKYLKIKRYRNEKDLENAIKFFINDVSTLIDTKFILIIPPVIDRYLEWNVREKGNSKAEVTREAIERMMKTDERYQEYLKSNSIEE